MPSPETRVFKPQYWISSDILHSCFYLACFGSAFFVFIQNVGLSFLSILFLLICWIGLRIRFKEIIFGDEILIKGYLRRDKIRHYSDILNIHFEGAFAGIYFKRAGISFYTAGTSDLMIINNHDQWERMVQLVFKERPIPEGQLLTEEEQLDISNHQMINFVIATGVAVILGIIAFIYADSSNEDDAMVALGFTLFLSFIIFFPLVSLLRRRKNGHN